MNSEGHFNLNTELLNENLFDDYSEGENFFTVFSIFFPAATGILAGSNISGDLKDPSVAIPKGTFSAIALTSVSYMILAVLLGAHSTRVASGFYGQSNDTSGICDIYYTDTPGDCFDDYYGPSQGYKSIFYLTIVIFRLNSGKFQNFHISAIFQPVIFESKFYFLT